jgi:hypothetical protein
VPGGLRLLIGMVRANRPWRLIIGLSKAGIGALGTTAAGLASTGVWNIADGMSALRVVGVALLSIAVTVGALIAVHDLWERAPRRGAPRRVLLFNLATTATITLGVVILYAALVAISLVTAALVIAPHVLSGQVNHPVDAVDYVRLACMVGSMATVGGALGSALESNRIRPRGRVRLPGRRRRRRLTARRSYRLRGCPPSATPRSSSSTTSPPCWRPSRATCGAVSAIASASCAPGRARRRSTCCGRCARAATRSRC